MPLPSCLRHVHPLQFLEGQFQEASGPVLACICRFLENRPMGPRGGPHKGGPHPEDADSLEQRGGLGPPDTAGRGEVSRNRTTPRWVARVGTVTTEDSSATWKPLSLLSSPWTLGSVEAGTWHTPVLTETLTGLTCGDPQREVSAPAPSSPCRVMSYLTLIAPGSWGFGVEHEGHSGGGECTGEELSAPGWGGDPGRAF